MGRRGVRLGLVLAVVLGGVWLAYQFFTSTALPGGAYALWHAAKTGDASTIRRLSTRPRDVKEQDRSGWTPLLLAAGMGHTAVVQALLNRGAEVNLQDNQGRTALIRATIMGYGDVVRLLLLAGADPNLGDHDGNTALHHAAFGSTNDPMYSGLWARVGPMDVGHIEPPRRLYAEITAALLDRGADARRKNRSGQTALAASIERKNAPVTHLLKQLKAEELPRRHGG
jgi:uncharacterized protein